MIQISWLFLFEFFISMQDFHSDFPFGFKFCSTSFTKLLQHNSWIQVKSILNPCTLVASGKLEYEGFIYGHFSLSSYILIQWHVYWYVLPLTWLGGPNFIMPVKQAIWQLQYKFPSNQTLALSFVEKNLPLCSQ